MNTAAIPEKACLFTLDRSGSMQAIAENVLAMYNKQLQELKGQTDLHFTLVQFDSTSTDVVHYRIPIAEVPQLTAETFQPRHSTPLLDAVGFVITKAKSTYKPDDKVVIVVLTDGAENASREFTYASVTDLVKEVSAWGWQVIFLGASFDVYKDARAAGVASAQTMTFNARDRGRALRTSGLVGQSMSSYYDTGASMSFSAADKAEAGDVFAQPQPAAQPDPQPAPKTEPKPEPRPEPRSTIDDITL